LSLKEQRGAAPLESCSARERERGSRACSASRRADWAKFRDLPSKEQRGAAPLEKVFGDSAREREKEAELL
jgi:hypothetical protein